MMSISGRSAAGAISYYLHLKEDKTNVKDDYYTREGEGLWMGKACEKLGLSGKVSAHDFTNLCNGFSPNGKALAKNAGAADHRAGWDLTFSAPKSISVDWSVAERFIFLNKTENTGVKNGNENKRIDYVAEPTKPHPARRQTSMRQMSALGLDAVAGRSAMLLHSDASSLLQNDGASIGDHDVRRSIDGDGGRVEIDVGNLPADKRQVIEDAHAYGIKCAMEFLQEKCAFSRTGHAGENQATVELIYAVFQHGTSRELDAALHSHVFVMNAGMRPDGTWGTLESKHFYEWQKVLGTIYQSGLGNYLERHGMAVSRDRDFIKLDGVPDPLCKETSTRRNQIEEKLAETGREGAEAAGYASLETRKNKNHDVTIEQLQPRWIEQAAAHGFNKDSIKMGAAIEREKISISELADRALAEATDKKSVLKETDIYLAAAQQVMENAQSVETIKEVAADMQSRMIELVKDASYYNDQGKFIERESVRFTTVELYQKEREILASAVSRESEKTHHLPPETVANAIKNYEEKKQLETGKIDWKMSPDQKNATEYLTLKSGGVALVIGNAGTGKSTLAEVVKDAYQAEGFKVIGCAPSNKAAVGLNEATGIESTSVHKLISDIEKNNIKLDEKTVIMVDEAAMMGSRTMHELERQASAAGSKLILMGDHKQLQSVEAGGVTRALSEKIKIATLDTNMRQTTPEHKSAVAQLGKGEIKEAMKYYAENGQIHVEKTHAKAVKQCVNLFEAQCKEHGLKNVVMLASTNKVINDLNKAVREELKKNGELGEERNYSQPNGKNSTEISLAIGDRVVFEAKSGKEFVNGDVGHIVGHDENNRILVQNERTGEQHSVDVAKTELRHGYAMTVHKAQGISTKAAIVMGSENLYREITNVMGTRAKELTHWVFTEAKLKKLEQGKAPTQKQIERAEQVEKARLQLGKEPKLPPNYEKDIKVCREYLKEHEPKIKLETQNEVDLDRIKNIFEAMSESKQKETTLDYQLREPMPEMKIERDQELERAQEEQIQRTEEREQEHEKEDEHAI